MDNYTFVHTRCLDGDLKGTTVEVRSGLSKADAEGCFRDTVKTLSDEIVNNEFLDGKVYIHKFKAHVRIEDEHHVVAITTED
ncbi:MAG: hypothetical protein ACI4CE_07445 [Methanomethylophilus alvi]